MAIEQTAGMRQLQGILDRGFVDDADWGGQGGRHEINNMDDLRNFVSRQSFEGRLPWDQSDLFNFFTAPEEEREMANAESRYRRMAAQIGDTSGQRSQQTAARLGIDNTSLGRRLTESGIAGAQASSRFGEGLSKIQQDTSRQLESNPNRLGFLDEVGKAYETGATGRGDAIASGGAVTGSVLGGLASALAAASIGPQGVVTGPIAALLALIAGTSGAVGTAAGQGGKADYIRSAGEALMKYRKPKIKMAKFETAGGPSSSGGGRQLATGGSNETALSNLFGPFDTEDQAPQSYLYRG